MEFERREILEHELALLKGLEGAAGNVAEKKGNGAAAEYDVADEVRKLVNARCLRVSPLLRRSARSAWHRRWWALLSIGPCLFCIRRKI